ncbi:MAG TPA: IS1634 family transposase, partial [Sandaracinaceae bacterium LLY-WYZ-13_1]|nr:IS1634 family transposase [Sandaracinaceae bacterium LLY-WYZ-13_1]
MEQRLDGQDRGVRYRCRPLSDGGAKIRFHEHLKETGLYRFIRVVAESQSFCYELDGQAFRREWRLDGKLLLITNVMDQQASTLVERYKSLADIERGFRTLKSELEIAPVHHRLPQRIRAHTLICFMALVI